MLGRGLKKDNVGAGVGEKHGGAETVEKKADSLAFKAQLLKYPPPPVCRLPAVVLLAQQLVTNKALYLCRFELGSPCSVYNLL